MNCLDTYALVEIREGSLAYAGIFDKEFIITDCTLAEFYWVNVRDFGVEYAKEWHEKLSAHGTSVSQEVLIAAMQYRYDHKKEDLSFFDCVGYLFAQEEQFTFVTGDRQFKHKKGVLFIQ